MKFTKKIKNDPFLNHFIILTMASTRGFEPPTYRLGGDCSIQLSYVDNKENYSPFNLFLSSSIPSFPYRNSRIFSAKSIE